MRIKAYNHNLNQVSSIKSVTSSPIKCSPICSPALNDLQSCSTQTPNSHSDSFERKTSPSFGGLNDLYMEKLGAWLNEMDKVVSQIIHEQEASMFINICSSKKIRKLLTPLKQYPMQYLLSKLLSNTDSINYLNNLFENAGIRKTAIFENFLNILNQNQETVDTFKSQSIEAVKIYGIINPKDDLAKFPDILLYLYNEEKASENPGYEKLNKYTAFLKKLGVIKSKQFEEKFPHLKAQFNDYKYTSDKVNAIKYLMESYDKKTSMLDKIINDTPELKTQQPDKIYQSINDFVDYIYEQNNGKSLGDLGSFINTALNFNKLKPYTYNTLKDTFNNFETTEDKIELCKFLKECNFTINELNNIPKNSIITDNDLLNIIIYKQSVINQLENSDLINKNEQENIYKNLSPLLTSAFVKEDNQEDGELLNQFIKIIVDYKINNQDKFLNFYNNINQTKERQITRKQLQDFIELFKYNNNSDILAEAKEKNTTAYKILCGRKQFFNDLEEKINNYIKSSDYFIGSSALDVYNNYYNLFKENPDNTEQILSQIETIGKDNSDDKYRKNEFKKFEKYFETKSEILDFITKNQINLNASKRCANYRNGCLKFLDIIFNSSDKETFKNKINQLSNSKFFIISKNHLNEFTESFKDETQYEKITDIIINKKITSIKKLTDFIKKYSSQNGENNNLIQHLYSTSNDITFDKYTQILDMLNDTLQKININTQINNDNILKIDMEKYKEKKELSPKDINNLICNISDKPSDKSFISTLENAYGSQCSRYSAHQIAEEILSKIGTTEESYKNLAQALNINKLNTYQTDSEYILTEALSEMLPKSFIDFVNSKEWMDDNESNEITQLPLHARLRLIDRFALNEQNNTDTLNEESTKEKLKLILKTIYKTIPEQISGSKESKRIITVHDFGKNKIKSVFSNKGQLITLMPVN